MAILVDARTRVICQGVTGIAGTYHSHRMMEYGTRIVAGVSPGRGGRNHLDVPVFDRVAEAMRETGANASAILVPPEHAASAIIEAIEAGIALVVVITEGVPIIDMVRVKEALSGSSTVLVGPSSQGILAPGLCQIGVMATNQARPGRVGVVSRSASLTSEVVSQLTDAGLGQSTTVGIGGDPIHGIGFADCLELFLADPDTAGIVMIGEIGSTEEQTAAEFLKTVKPTKPIVALIAGQHAPVRRRMGHAGALITRGRSEATAKIDQLHAVGVEIASSAHLVGATMRAALPDEAAKTPGASKRRM
jgi:succinyl-CoA synthetase alpha subunit